MACKISGSHKQVSANQLCFYISAAPWILTWCREVTKKCALYLNELGIKGTRVMSKPISDFLKYIDLLLAVLMFATFFIISIDCKVLLCACV